LIDGSKTATVERKRNEILKFTGYQSEISNGKEKEKEDNKSNTRANAGQDEF